MIKTAIIIEDNSKSDEVGLSDTVTLYIEEDDVDETYTVKSGDMVEMHRGYHPYHCAPGYEGYYLWIMAGKDRGFFMTTDEEHKWLNK